MEQVYEERVEHYVLSETCLIWNMQIMWNRCHVELPYYEGRTCYMEHSVTWNMCCVERTCVRMVLPLMKLYF